MSISKNTKERLVVALADDKSGKEVTALLEKTERLERQLSFLLQKMDSDTGITDTNYETTVETVE